VEEQRADEFIFSSHQPLAKTVCAVVVTYNGGAIVSSTFDAVIDQVGHLLVVDNHSDAATLEYLKEIKSLHPEKVTTILNAENKGLAAALNQGVKFALSNGFEWLLTLDQDTFVAPDMVAALLNGHINDPRKDEIAIMAPSTILVTDSVSAGATPETFFKSRSVKGRPLIEVDLIHTSGNLVRTVTFASVGLFREEFFIDQVDYDFCFRLRRAGLKIVVNQNTTIRHRVGQMRSARFFFRRVFCSNHSAERRYYIARNGTVLSKETKNWQFIRRHLTILFKESVKVLLYEEGKLEKLKLTIRGIKDGLNGRLGIFNRL
jgi:rhamnosyltransferase